jgi:hypothetical protein
MIARPVYLFAIGFALLAAGDATANGRQHCPSGWVCIEQRSTIMIPEHGITPNSNRRRYEPGQGVPPLWDTYTPQYRPSFPQGGSSIAPAPRR